MTDFQKKLLGIIQELDGEQKTSLYDEIVKFYQVKSRQISYNQQDTLYSKMRCSGFIVDNEDDAAVYVDHVAKKHSEKFQTLYHRFFIDNKSIFESDISLVVWGCGIGLDLFAFYDAAMRQEKPELWVRVRHIVLMDVAPWALERAREVAEILFPTAKVITKYIDFTDTRLLNELEQLKIDDNPLVPRVHLISNVLDLIVEHRASFFNAFCFLAQKRGKVNEFLLMFSPQYGDLRSQKEKIDPCIETFVTDCNMILERGLAPINDGKTIYFSYRMLDKYWSSKEAYDTFFTAPLFKDLRSLVLELWKDSKGLFEKTDLQYLFHFVKRGALDRYYQSVKVDFYKPKEADPIGCILFCPKQDEAGRYYRPLVYCHDKQAKTDNICDKIYGTSYKKGYKHPLKKQTIFISFNDLKGSRLLTPRLYLSNEFSENIDFEALFFLRAKDATLPTLEQLDKKQKEVAVARKQFKKVRGSAGAGKTMAMLWHGILAYRRTHLPILFLGKTNSLLSINSHRFAAAFEGCSISNEMVEFRTVNDFLCKEFGSLYPCKADEDKCRMCNEEAFAKIKHGASVKKKYGAILVDEAQGIESQTMEAIFDATGKAFPRREFYFFCDEQQTLHKNKGVLEDGDKEKLNGSKKKVVKAPAKGFGPYVTLSGNHRFKNEKLTHVAQYIQAMQKEDYAIDELAIKTGPIQENLFEQNAFKVSKGNKTQIQNGLQQLCNLTLPNKGGTKDAIVVMCASQKEALDFGKENLSDILPSGWKLYRTHTAENTANEEAKKCDQEARRNFREYNKTLHITTIDCMQGHTFSKVLFVIDREISSEELFTACTRARDILYVLDLTDGHTYYTKLKQFN